MTKVLPIKKKKVFIVAEDIGHFRTFCRNVGLRKTGPFEFGDSWCTVKYVLHGRDLHGQRDYYIQFLRDAHLHPNYRFIRPYVNAARMYGAGVMEIE